MKKLANEKKILVIQLARFGDFLQTTPLLAALKAQHPQSHLAVLVNSDQKAVAFSNPHIDEILTVNLAELKRSVEKPLGLSGQIAALSEAVKFLTRRRFNLVINLNTSRLAALLSELVQADERRGPRLGTDRRRLDTAPWADLIMNLMIRRRLIRFNLVDLLVCYADIESRPTDGLVYPLSSRTRARAGAFLGPDPGRPLVGLQLGSRRLSRQWPPENFAALAARLMAEHQAGIVLLGAPEEKSLAETFLQHLAANDPYAPSRIINLTGRTSMDELAGVLAHLDLLVTTDTGPMHLAAAVKTPILALFIGPAFCHETGPYGPGHLILQVRTECSPCLEKNAGCDHFCRRLITPETAAQAARWLLSRGRTEPPGPADLGDQVSLLMSDLDDFGVVYRPLAPNRLAAADLKALAYREAGRRFMRPAYRLDLKRLVRDLNGHDRACVHELKNFSKTLKKMERFLLEKNGDPEAKVRLFQAAGGNDDLEPLAEIVFSSGDRIRSQGIGQMIGDMARVSAWLAALNEGQPHPAAMGPTASEALTQTGPEGGV